MKAEIELTAADFRVGQMVYSCHKPFGCKWFIEEIGETFIKLHGLDNQFPISEIKPILRRMDSMTEEETIKQEYFFTIGYPLFLPDWLDSNGFDRPRIINGVSIPSLILAGLAVDAATLERSV